MPFFVYAAACVCLRVCVVCVCLRINFAVIFNIFSLSYAFTSEINLCERSALAEKYFGLKLRVFLIKYL